VIELTMTPQGRIAVPRQPIHQLVRPAQLARASTRLLDLRAGAR
jgi:hypothetical protein